ncbi:beta-1,4-glucuronyltransferase 1-like [Neocloeon triangulifer]|uniref:beta-1,4-glucuronyltransferase 1-like n=1 Tax=Neocloeon triangulifer TaxID=2078957 RepID=UPI00286F86ED|nr:beta-1,4-glucuronyltransferase 1-like [Neocloeon triangulifer]
MARLIFRYAYLLAATLVLCYATINRPGLHTTSRSKQPEKQPKFRSTVTSETCIQVEYDGDDMNVFNVPSRPKQQQDWPGLLAQTLQVKGHWDDRARYKHFPDAFLANHLLSLSKYETCMATHGTVEAAGQVVRAARNWPGAISLAVFAPASDFLMTVVFIRHLRKCFPSVRDQVTWHLSYPRDMPPSLKNAHLLQLDFPCSMTTTEVLTKLRDTVDAKDTAEVRQIVYPQNSMRNLARRHCRNEWVVCPDLDMVFPDPSEGASPFALLNRFLGGPMAADLCREKKCAFVLPLYEVENVRGEGRVPPDKDTLLQMVRKGHAQIYHLQVFDGNQGRSNLTAWEQLPPVSEVQVAFRVNFSFLYEPVYIAKHGSPDFEERFLGYGMTRNTQVLEMHLSGYEFYLLDSIFLSHLWGILKKKNYNHARFQQIVFNSRLFHTFFMRELAFRHQQDLSTLVSTPTGLKPMFRTNINVETCLHKPSTNNAQNKSYFVNKNAKIEFRSTINNK